MGVLINKINTMILIVITLFLTNSINLFADYSFTGGGKSYQIVETKTSWASAASDAASKGCYLVHIDSQTEQTLIWNAITSKINTTYTIVNDGGGIANIWIGANDLTTEGTWVWDGDNTGASTNFWTGQGSAGNDDGQVIGGKYINWGGLQQYSAPKEPDNYGSNQDAAGIALKPWPKNNGSLGKAGEWNDISASNAIYYIIEYDYDSKPAKPSLPQGSNQVVKGALGVVYSTEEVANTKEYKWQVEPNNAAELAQELNQVTVNWSKEYIGTAYLSVQAINDCGESEFSDKFAVEVKDSSASSIFYNDNSQISLFPIPAIDKLNVKFNGLINPNNIKIYDNFGSLVKEIKVEPNQFNISITTTDLEVGAYNFVFEYPNKMISRKVIVIR